MERLGTLAAVLKFGMRFEDPIIDFYSNLANNDSFSDIEEDLNKFAQSSKDHRDTLQDIYHDCSRSDMDMGALEPVSGIEAENYEVDTDISGLDRSEILKKAVEIEEKSSNFYRDIGEKADYLSSGRMNRIADQKDGRKETLKGFLE